MSRNPMTRGGLWAFLAASLRRWGASAVLVAAVAVSAILVAASQPAVAQDAPPDASGSAAAPAAPTAAPMAAPTSAIISDALVAEIKEWAHAEIVHIALKAQNVRHKGLSEEQIIKLDKDWRAQRKSDAQPLIAQLFGSPLSNYLLLIQAQSIGLYTEMFVMDNLGLNVGQSAITSDYWQGDEAKFQKSYGAGAGAVFIDEAEFHKGSGTYRAQVNLTIADEGGAAIGAITVEVNLTELQRRQALGG